jgi:hypothetical protein
MRRIPISIGTPGAGTRESRVITCLPLSAETGLQSPSTDIKRIAIKREKSRLLLPLPFIFYPKMPPTRTPFKEISGNHIHKHNVSPYWRGVIAREARKGSIATEIAKDLNLDRETIRRTISLDHLRDEGKSLPKAARKLSYTPLDERHILH